MINPTFSEYESAASLAGHRITKFPTMNLGENLEKFSKIIPKNGCVFICNPNNPTGLLAVTDGANSKNAQHTELVLQK